MKLPNIITRMLYQPPTEARSYTDTVRDAAHAAATRWASRCSSPSSRRSVRQPDCRSAAGSNRQRRKAATTDAI